MRWSWAPISIRFQQTRNGYCQRFLSFFHFLPSSTARVPLNHHRSSLPILTESLVLFGLSPAIVMQATSGPVMAAGVAAFEGIHQLRRPRPRRLLFVESGQHKKDPHHKVKLGHPQATHQNRKEKERKINTRNRVRP